MCMYMRACVCGGSLHNAKYFLTNLANFLFHIATKIIIPFLGHPQLKKPKKGSFKRHSNHTRYRSTLSCKELGVLNFSKVCGWCHFKQLLKIGKRIPSMLPSCLATLWPACNYSGAPLMWTPWGPGEVSCIQWIPSIVDTLGTW